MKREVPFDPRADLASEAPDMSSIGRILEGQTLDESVWLEFGEFCTSLQVERTWVSGTGEPACSTRAGPRLTPGRSRPAHSCGARADVATGQRPRRESRGVALILDLLGEAAAARARFARPSTDCWSAERGG